MDYEFKNVPEGLEAMLHEVLGVMTHTTQKGAASVEHDLRKTPVRILLMDLVHGAKQKVVDAAANAKKVSDETDSDIVECATGMMQQVVDKQLAGVWGKTRSGFGAGLSTLDREIVKIVRPLVKGKNAAWYKAATPGERDAACMEAYAGANDAQRDTIVNMAQKRLDEARAEKEALGGLDIDIAI